MIELFSFRLDIKPLGACKRNYYEYQEYRSNIQSILPDIDVPDYNDFYISLDYSVHLDSGVTPDCDNVLKNIQDAIAAFYGFNDTRISKVSITKDIADKKESTYIDVKFGYLETSKFVGARQYWSNFVDLYSRGVSAQRIAKKYHTDPNVVLNELKKHGCKIRSMSEAANSRDTQKPVSQTAWDNQDYICEQFLAGITVFELSREFKVTEGIIYKVLADTDIDVRCRARNFQKEICDMYQNGTGIVEIANHFKSSDTQIKKILTDNKIDIRSRAKQIKISKRIHPVWQNQETICQRYLDGETMTSISKDYHCDRSTIKHVLTDNEIKIDTKRRSSH